MVGQTIGALASTFTANNLDNAAAHLRNAADGARREALIWAAVVAAAGMGAVCLTAAAWFALAPRTGNAEAAGILGGLYLLIAGIAILMRRRAS